MSHMACMLQMQQFKNNILAETALGSGTTDNLQTFLKYPFLTWCKLLSSTQVCQQTQIYSWIII